ncbi:MAG: tetratricopeptide repeat protein [Planctomycetaceae bacterium]
MVQNENLASAWIFCNALINRGCKFGSEAYYGLAEDDFQRAIAKCGISPDLLVRAQFNLGNVYWNTREYPRAIEYFELVLQSSVNVTDLKELARCKMAHSLEKLG